MYVPEHFSLTGAALAELLVPVLAGDLITAGPNGLQATFIPMLYEPGTGRDGDLGVLSGHLSRVNDQWRHPGEALFIVHGPDAFIEADWLSLGTAISVPTWNYLTVHVHGELSVHPEVEWCAEAVGKLSAARGDHSVEALSSQEVDSLLRSIVGVKLRITALIGKAKMSQNKPPEVVEQVIGGLEANGQPEVASWMRANSLPRAQAKADLLAGIRQRHVEAD